MVEYTVVVRPWVQHKKTKKGRKKKEKEKVPSGFGESAGTQIYFIL